MKTCPDYLVLVSIVIVLGLVSLGCGTPKHPEPTIHSSAREPLSSEAQRFWDRLVEQCASPIWAKQFDMIERPETLPPNFVISGEVLGFLLLAKDRLAESGVLVKWNHEKLLYEVDDRR